MESVEAKEGVATRAAGGLNLGFVALAAFFMEFCALIFPLIERFFTQLGAPLLPPTEIVFIQCMAVATHPLIALGAFAVAYFMLLRFGNARLRAMVNAVLALYFAATLLFLGLPIWHIVA